MFVLKLLVKTVKLLNSETSTNAIGLAIGLGMFLGLVPFLTVQAIVALMVVLFFRVNITGTLVAFLLFWPLSVALRSPLDTAGSGLLEAGALKWLWTMLYHAPVLHYFGLHNSVTLSGTLLALLLFVPLFLLVRVLVNIYRDRVNEWVTGLALFNVFRASKLYRIYTWIDSPFGT